MFKRWMFLLLMIAGTLLTAAVKLAESSFTAVGKTVTHDYRAKNFGYFKGVVPLKWNENFSSWTKSSAESKLVKDPSGDYLQFTVLKITGGAPQFFMTIPELLPGKTYRMTATVRNQSDSEASLTLRMLPAPYKTLKALKLGISPQWQTVSQTFSLKEKSPVQLGLFLILDGEGIVDFKNITLEELAPEDLENKVLMNTNFFENTVDRSKDSSAKGLGKFSGVLPAQWHQDFSHFTKAEASTQIVNLGPQHFLQFKILKGEPQFLAPLQDVKAGKNYTLTTYVRNRTGAPVKMSLRIMPSPYSTLAAANIQPCENWTRQVLNFKVPDKKLDLPVALMMNFEEKGDFDIVNMKLEETEGARDIVKRPPAGSKNFFRNTRLPLGLQSGWAYLRGHTYGSIAPDSAVKGPSGESALKLESLPGKQLGFVSEPFNVADPNAKNAVSFSYRGTGTYTAAVITQGRELATLRLAPSADWKRVSVPFKAPADSWAFTLRLAGSGTIHIDAFRASAANDANYVPAGECEIAFALPKSETSASRIQFADERPLLNYYVSGNANDVFLKFKIVNIYGESKELPPVKISDSKRAGTIDYLVFPGKQFGQFRVEAQAFRGKNAVSPANEMIVTRLERPVYWGKDAPNSPFGIHAMAFDDSLKALKAGGVNWTRLHDAGAEYICWFYLEPQKGKWSFRDDDIKLYRKNHIRIFGQYGMAPKWASHLSKVDTGRKWISYHDRYFQPLNLNEFENYVTTVTARYKGVIDDWFVWNEPWIVAWWGVGYNKNSRVHDGYITSKTPQADFAKLSKTAYLAAKKVNPNVKVSGFNTTSGGTGERWTKGVYDADGLKFCDTVDFHFYTPRSTGFPGDAAEYAVKDATGYIVAKNGKIGKPLYMSEGQGASGGGVSGDTTMRYAGMYKHSVPWDNKENYDSIADRNVRYLLSMLSYDVKRIFLYSAHCYSDFSNAPNFLVMFNADGFPHPMLAAHSAMARRLEDMKFVKTKELGKDLWAYFFTDGKKSTAVLSGKYKARGTKITCSLKNAKAADLYGNPVKFPVIFEDTVLYVEAPVSADKLERSLK